RNIIFLIMFYYIFKILFLAIEDYGEASYDFNVHEWFDDVIKNNEIIKYDYDVFENLKYIGRGAFGSVHSATLVDEKMIKMKVALKPIVVDSIKLFVNEVNIILINICC